MTVGADTLLDDFLFRFMLAHPDMAFAAILAEGKYRERPRAFRIERGILEYE